MDDLVLNIFSNQRKSRISKKQYQQVPVRDSQKKLIDSSKKMQSLISISKNIDQPKSSDAFKNLMKGVFQMGKRIQDKYSTKNMESNNTINTKEGSSKKTDKTQDNRWKQKIDKINQEKNQDDEHNNINNKQQIGVGTSFKNFTWPVSPTRVYSPEGSRIVQCPDGSKIIFPPQISHMRPVSTPKPLRINLGVQQPSIASRIVYQRSLSPNHVMIPQPIVRKNIQQPIRVVSYPLPHQPHQNTKPQVYFTQPSQVHPIQTINPVIHRYIQNPQQIQYVNQPQQIYQHPYPIHMIQQPIPINSNIQQNLSPYLPNNPQISTQKIQKQQPVIVQQNIQSQKQNKISTVPQNVDKVTSQSSSLLPKITAEQYQAMLAQQYQNYNAQNIQLLKHLSQLSQQQRNQKQNQQLLQQFLKNNQNNQVVKNIINEKQITKINKVVQKKIINKENIKNVQNVRNQENIMNTINQANVLNIANMENMQNIQNWQNLQNIQNIQSLSSQENSMALKYLQQGFINPMMLTNQVIKGNTSEKSIKQPLKPILQNVVNPSQKKISSKNIALSQKKIPQQQPILSPEGEIHNKKMQQKIFNQVLQDKISSLDKYGQHIEVGNQLSDLSDLKKNNYKQGMVYLKKMDAILDKYSKPSKPTPKLQNSNKKSNQQNPINTIINQFFPSNNKKQQKQLDLNQSKVDTYMPITLEPNQKTDSQIQPQVKQYLVQQPKQIPSHKQFLSLTKNMVFDFFSSFNK